MRAKDLRDKLLPKWVKSNTEIDDPTFDKPMTDNDAPRRPKARRDKAAPKVAKS
jgi:hypothetical protein